MSNDPSPRTWRGAPRWVKWLLCLSLAMNLVIIGVAVGAAFKFQRHAHGGHATVGRIMWALPHESRDRARDLLRAARPDLRTRREERREASDAVAATIEASPYDPAATRAAFAALREKDQAIKASTHEIMLDILAVLPAEERAAVARSLRKRRH